MLPLMIPFMSNLIITGIGEGGLWMQCLVGFAVLLLPALIACDQHTAIPIQETCSAVFCPPRLDCLGQLQAGMMLGYGGLQDDIWVSRAPGRLDVMGGIADYSGSLVLQMPIAPACHVAAQKHPPDAPLRLWRHIAARHVSCAS